LNRALLGARGRVDSGLRHASQQLTEYRAAARKHYRNGRFHAQVSEPHCGVTSAAGLFNNRSRRPGLMPAEREWGGISHPQIAWHWIEGAVMYLQLARQRHIFAA
jgi:hypothetical protein